MNIGWFGLGKLGMICSEKIVDKGHSVTGYDIKEVDSNKVDVVTNPRLAVENKDFVFVAVQTPHDPAYGGETPITHLPNKDFGIDNVKSCLKKINKYATEEDEGEFEVTVQMIVDTLAHEFPEFVMIMAEENWVRGYQQGIDDATKLPSATSADA